MLLRVFTVAGVDSEVIATACDLAWQDFEDAVQMAAGNGAGCIYLVTRNPGDYPGKQLIVTQPAEFFGGLGVRRSLGYEQLRS
ncbi:MAG: hypothetical protein PHQ40_18800 [Anaerolineaceae bacterium]|nr:hypothetical protein [Anaerolineaceae bacterium]